MAGGAFVALALAVAVLPDGHARLLADTSNPAFQRAHPVAQMTSDELAFRIVDRDPSLVVIDLRPREEFAKASLRVLQGGWRGFQSDILAFAAADAPAPRDELTAFRAEAGRQIASLMSARASARTVVEKPKRIAGGCGV